MKSKTCAALFAITAGLGLPLLSGLPASAVSVTIGSATYDVEIYKGSYADNPSLFAATPPGKMPWWEPGGSGGLASQFASQVYDQLGAGTIADYGPIFAYDIDSGAMVGLAQMLSDPNAQVDLNSSTPPPLFADINSIVSYAFVRSPSSVPGPLPVFGAAAAIGWSRRIRRRIAKHRG